MKLGRPIRAAGRLPSSKPSHACTCNKALPVYKYSIKNEVIRLMSTQAKNRQDDRCSSKALKRLDRKGTKPKGHCYKVIKSQVEITISKLRMKARTDGTNRYVRKNDIKARIHSKKALIDVILTQGSELYIIEERYKNNFQSNIISKKEKVNKLLKQSKEIIRLKTNKKSNIIKIIKMNNDVFLYKTKGT